MGGWGLLGPLHRQAPSPRHGKGLCFLSPGPSAEVALVLVPVLHSVSPVFPMLLVQFVVVALVVVLVVPPVSPHAVGPSGCREEKEDRRGGYGSLAHLQG